MDLNTIISQLESFAEDHVLSSEENMSDADSETLEAAEEEARFRPITRHNVEVFDKLPDGMRKRRYITAWPGEEMLPCVSDEKFTELFRGHVKRKRTRKKFRLNPDYEPPEEAPSKKDSFARLTNGTGERPDHKIKKIRESFKDYGEASESSPERKKKPTTIEQFNQRRKKLYAAIMKKEISKGQKARNFNQKERIANRKRISVQCMRAVRQKAMLSQRFTKETVSRAKRLTREMQNHWKKFDRVERQQKRLLEKEAEEQQKMDLQLLEAKRQQRKLNFLITQTELYAHFMANKVGSASKNEADILGQLDEKTPLPITTIKDEYDSEMVKNQAKQNALKALQSHDKETNNFDIDCLNLKKEDANENRPQPGIFKGTLKKYQLKGMNWLLNLYDQGINGILADEMGLGKTVQALAMLAHIAEHYNIWGPFLVITPASTLHNWQQEVAKFIPAFKVIPYWGSPQERKILRQFWDPANLHHKSSNFHVVITSYQIVIMDFKHLNRMKWQYLVLDEAQAIKSSSSQRWKMLLEFKCRNRLLLSGTPIQNTMAELWALLHFVMPTLFDSHDEFNDWFSKDIESSAESGKNQVDELQISRLHMILKPFMLRRIKKDVENELTEKLEVLTYCPLTIRQKHLYSGLKRKIRIEDLLQGFTGSSQTSSITSSLMNLVMQFRKVCNHPELFERRDTRSPFVMKSLPYEMPKLLYKNYFSRGLKPNIRRFHSPENVHYQRREVLEVPEDPFAFLRIAKLSPGEFDRAFNDFSYRIRSWSNSKKNQEDSKIQIMSYDEPIYGYNQVKIKVMKETLSHRVIRSKKSENNLVSQIPHKSRPDVIRTQLCAYPEILMGAAFAKVVSSTRFAYAYDSEWPWRSLTHLNWVGEAKNLTSPLPHQVNIQMPDKETLVSDAGKLFVLDGLLTKLKAEGHRVLIYSQMTKMIDLLEEYMNHRKHTYIRLDGSSKIHERRDMVNDFQQRSDIFVFLLSTRAGGLGINLTAADTVIFYDSDWNPTVDQQAMDRAHRLGQTKQVTVYRLICKGTIEERILQRAREKSEIQRMVIQGGSFKGSKPGELRPKEVVSLLLDDEELERKYNVKKVDEMMENEESWNEDELLDIESSATTSRNTTRAPSPVLEPRVIEEKVVEKVEAKPVQVNQSSGGRSKRQAKRPPKRFDD